MDQLVNLVSEKTGISKDQARQAVTIVLNFLKERLPQPVAAQIDNVLSGKGGSNLASDLGGMLGGKKG